MTSKVVSISANTSWYIYNFRLNTIRALLDNEFIVHLVAPRDEYSERLIELGCSYSELEIDGSGLNPVRDVLTLLSYVRIYGKVRPFCAFHFTPKVNIYGNFAAAILGVRVVSNVAGLGKVFSEPSILQWIVSFLYRISLSRAEAVLFQNEEDMNLFLANGLVCPGKAKRIPGSGVDLDRFKPVPFDSNQTTTFLLLSRMLKEKGVYEFMEAAKIICDNYELDLQFQILGPIETGKPNSISKEEIELVISDYPITYLGATDFVEDYIGQSNCVVLPSYYSEGVPRSLLEAAAMGKPIITTDNVGCRDTVDHLVTGFLCEPRSVESLVESLMSFLSLSDLERMEMGARGRKKMELEFNEKIVIDEYMGLISSGR